MERFGFHRPTTFLLDISLHWADDFEACTVMQKYKLLCDHNVRKSGSNNHKIGFVVFKIVAEWMIGKKACKQGHA